ncbi:MAG: ABC transporter ATP-binding protein [Methylococcus sp.]
MAAVHFERLTKIYPNGHVALSELDLRIEDGELMVVVGPSGCGKSTFLRILAGLEEITAGTLWIGERRANGLSPQARNIAMVFQDYALYPTMTVRENLAFPLRMRKLPPPERERRVTWAAELLELGGVLDRRPRELSGGQRQRVAMGRALVREPSVFLLDEPLSNLDAKLRAQVRAEIGDLQRRTGTTMIYVTHDQVEAMTLGRRIAVLHRGQLQQVADPQTLYAAPANPVVAGFIGSPPMNLFPAELKPAADGECRVRTAGQVVAVVMADSARQALAAMKGAPTLTAGIRPEALRPAKAGEPGFSVTVLNVEYLGHETLVHCRPGSPDAAPGPDQAWIVRLPGMPALAPNEPLRLAYPAPGEVHLFPDNPATDR